MDDPCPIQRDKKLLNLLTKELDHVISQEYFKSQMAVCQKYLEGEPKFFLPKKLVIHREGGKVLI